MARHALTNQVNVTQLKPVKPCAVTEKGATNKAVRCIAIDHDSRLPLLRLPGAGGEDQPERVEGWLDLM